MECFTVHEGIAAPLIKPDIDTDAIIPSREMTRVSKSGLAGGLFAGWRYLDQRSRTPNPEFVLNRPEYAGVSILLAGANFGCGSSREHAVWALKEFGIRAIVAPSFGSIFRNNCIRNGVLPVVLGEAAIATLVAVIQGAPEQARLTIDLEWRHVRSTVGQIFRFSIAGNEREMLLEGLDAIALTLRSGDAIEAFQQADRQVRPWLYLDREID